MMAPSPEMNAVLEDSAEDSLEEIPVSAAADSVEEIPVNAPALTNIKDFTLPRLTEWFAENGQKAFRAKQVFGWLYQQRVKDFEEMTTLSKPLRALLAESFTPGTLTPEAVYPSVDGSRKFVFRMTDGQLVETVLMPNNTHYTLCVSTQVGCAMNCSFCMTAKMGLTRNLSAGEIMEQVVAAAREVEEGSFIRNVVFMGMGEPLHNYDNLMASLEILNEDHGFGLSRRRVTVSTSGLVPAIRRFAKEGIPRASLAISLNGARDEVRGALMPINKRWNIDALLEACRELPTTGHHRITFEYILIKDVTDDLADARLLVKRLHGLKCKVNLIPYNAGPESPYQAPDPDHARAFQEVLLKKGLLATMRISKGQDIQAACGQLITELKNKHSA